MATTIGVNIPPYEGEYELDINARAFTSFEWRVIKRVSGYLPLTIDKGWDGGDPDLILSLALIAMVRAGRIEKKEIQQVAEIIEDAEADGVAITVKIDEEEEDDDEAGEADPTQHSSPGDETPSGGESSGDGTELSSENENPSGTGSLVSLAGLDFDHPISPR
jgi:hypothetical protein